MTSEFSLTNLPEADRPETGTEAARPGQVGLRSSASEKEGMRGFAFIGLKHSGKTNHARRLAELLNMDFFDLDDCILQANPSAGTIRELYTERGEAWFRGAELSALEDLPHDNFVLASGGGSMENQPLMNNLKQRRMLMVFLDAPENLLFERIQNKGLPPFLQTRNPVRSFHIIYKRRRPLALQAADVHIEAGSLMKDELFELIKRHLGHYLPDHHREGLLEDGK